MICPSDPGSNPMDASGDPAEIWVNSTTGSVDILRFSAEGDESYGYFGFAIANNSWLEVWDLDNNGLDQTEAIAVGAQLINIAYVSGESSFMIAVGDGNMVSFFGRDSTAVGNAATIAISRITATFGDDTTSLSARGQCRYTNPYAGVSTVTCNATTARGLRYSLVFRSDGNPPTVQRMQR